MAANIYLNAAKLVATPAPLGNKAGVMNATIIVPSTNLQVIKMQLGADGTPVEFPPGVSFWLEHVDLDAIQASCDADDGKNQVIVVGYTK